MPYAYNLRGNLFTDEHKYDEAIQDYQKAIELDPKLSASYSNWGFSLTMQGDLKGAIAKYKKAIELEPKLSAAYSGWGVALDKQGDLKGAIDKSGRPSN